MPAAFTGQQRENLRLRLLEAGRKTLPIVGLKKVSIEELAAMAGIAKGSFYTFFDSKEALYAALIADEARGVDTRVLGSLRRHDLTPRAAFSAFVRALMHEYAVNPVLRRLIESPDDLRAVQAKVGDARHIAKAALGFGPVLEFLKQAEASGALREAPETILGAIASLPFLLLHKDELAVVDWPKTENFFVRSIVNAAFEPEGD